MDSDSNTRPTSQYNLNDRTTTLIADLQEEALSLSNSINFSGSFNKWQSIRLLIEARFDVNEIKILDKLEQEFLKPMIINYPNNLSIYKPMRGLSEKDSYIKDKQLRIKKEKLYKYVKYIMTMMRLYKIGLTDKEKKTRLD